MKIHKKGWGLPGDSKKAHYFIFKEGEHRGMSLCGKWFYGGKLFDNHHNHPLNCKRCMRKRDKLFPPIPDGEGKAAAKKED